MFKTSQYQSNFSRLDGTNYKNTDTLNVLLNPKKGNNFQHFGFRLYKCLYFSIHFFIEDKGQLRDEL